MPRVGDTYSLPAGYQATSGQTATAAQHNDPLEDLRDEQNSDRPVVHGGTGASTASAARNNLGVAIGSDVQAHGDVLDDLNTLGVNSADGEILVGTGAGALAWESGATARTSLGLGTGDSPTFEGLDVDGTGNAAQAWVTVKADSGFNFGYRLYDHTGTQYGNVLWNDGSDNLTVGNITWTSQTLAGSWSVGSTLNVDGNTIGSTPWAALAAYEEGTFTPGLEDESSNAATFASRNGEYVRIGKICIATVDLANIDTTGLTAGEKATITGFPFTADASVNHHGTVDVVQTSIDDHISARLVGGGTTAFLRNNNSLGNPSAVSVSEVTSGTANFTLTIAYKVA